MATAWIGTSGWVYSHWKDGAFYPPKMPAAAFLPYFATQFGSVEINYSYYQLPPRNTFELWQQNVPDRFVFSVKASRYLTHMKKLKDPQEPLERLLHNAGGLGNTFGPVLFQFPARWKLDRDRLQGFLSALQAHPDHRYAFEFRHKSWLTADVYACLREHHAALCLPIGWGIPLDVQLTADWTYVRFHGGERSPSSRTTSSLPGRGTSDSGVVRGWTATATSTTTACGTAVRRQSTTRGDCARWSTHNCSTHGNGDTNLFRT
jgi:uncharacterized protein YecE (DUF72 family)